MMTSSDYQGLWSTAVLTTDPTKLRELDYVTRVALANESLYRAVQLGANVPWPVVAAIHFRESNQHFSCNLLNGDSLTARTVHVPAGRPVNGNPPFRWQDCAIDALKGIWMPIAWDIPGCLEFMERYNGIGYQKQGINTPYVWDYTTKYVSGLFVADGKFDPNKVEMRPGCAAILKVLQQKGISLDSFTTLPSRALVH